MTNQGAVKSRWVNTGDDTYYFNDNGEAAKGWTEISDILYYFDNDGKLARGWKTIDGHKYYLDNGAQLRGPFSKDGNYYVIGDVGYAQEGWATWNTLRYYTNSDGVALTNTTETIDGQTYAFDESGVARRI